MSQYESESIHEHYSLFFSERTDRLHAMLTNCGHELTTSRSYVWDGLKRGQAELVIWQYTLAGMGRLRFGENEYPLPPGSAALLVVPENHCYYLPEDSPGWRFLFVSVYGSELVRLVTDFRRSHGFLLRHEPDSPAVTAAWGLLEKCREKKLDNRYRASAAAYDFVMSLFSEPAGRGTHAQDDFLKRVHAYALANLSRPLSVGDLADAVGCSRWHFSRRFQQLEGKSPHEFVTDLKMRLAVRLLQTTNGSVKEVAENCGFEDASYFCKVFRSHYGVSPAGFRSGAES